MRREKKMTWEMGEIQKQNKKKVGREKVQQMTTNLSDGRREGGRDGRRERRRVIRNTEVA